MPEWRFFKNAEEGHASAQDRTGKTYQKIKARHEAERRAATPKPAPKKSR